MARASGLYQKDPMARSGEGNVSTRRRVSRAGDDDVAGDSDGTIVRKSAQQYQEALGRGHAGRMTACAGPLVCLDGKFAAGSGCAEVFEKHGALIASLAELRKAPLVEEEYHGPLLLSSDAGADTLRGLLARRAVTATRPKLGTEARTNGPFASSFHALVTAGVHDVVDDPGLKSFNGKGLVGAYDVDEEGVAAQAVKLVTAGRLENYLLGREPVRDFPQSNGHGRAGITGTARPAIGVLKVTAENGSTDDELNRKAAGDGQGSRTEERLFVQTLGGEMTPRLLYRVNADGTRELVRGAVLDDIDQRALRSSIAAAGKDCLWPTILATCRKR
jgi:TldD protein